MRLALHWQILIAMAAAIAAGWVTGPEGAALPIYAFIGKFFLNALKMLIVPLILASIINAVLGLSASGALGRLGLRTIAYYLMTSFLAILVGVFLVNLINPGLIDGQPLHEQLGGMEAAAALAAEKVAGKDSSDFVEIFLRMVPPNIVAAAAQGQMLGLIVFGILFGYFASRLNERLREGQTNFWEAVYEIMIGMTHLVMRFAPIGVFGLVAKVVAESGGNLAAFQAVGWFFLTVIGALLLHALVTLPTVLKVIARVNPLKHYSAMGPALLTAFSTSSSAATLPVTIRCVEENAGVSKKSSGFVLPLGATVNMDGTALYECVAALFIAQAYGLELSIGTQVLVVVTALLTSVGVAGVPSASLVAISVILGAIGLPVEALGLILIVDRILDMCRTAVNVFSDSCGAVVIARLDGEKTNLAAN